jgi:hypothetical protein
MIFFMAAIFGLDDDQRIYSFARKTSGEFVRSTPLFQSLVQTAWIRNRLKAVLLESETSLTCFTGSLMQIPLSRQPGLRD